MDRHLHWLPQVAVALQLGRAGKRAVAALAPAAAAGRTTSATTPGAMTRPGRLCGGPVGNHGALRHMKPADL